MSGSDIACIGALREAEVRSAFALSGSIVCIRFRGELGSIEKQVIVSVG